MDGLTIRAVHWGSEALYAGESQASPLTAM